MEKMLKEKLLDNRIKVNPYIELHVKTKKAVQ